MSQDELVDVVDEDDNVVSRATKNEVQRQGLRHRIVRVALEDFDGNILIQKRQQNIELYPDCWDNAASGHVDCGESYDDAAKRELYEEIGVMTKLTRVKYYPSSGQFGWRKLNRWNTLYRAVIPAETTLTLQVDEVADARWVSRTELRELVECRPGTIADGLKEVYEILYKP